MQPAVPKNITHIIFFITIILGLLLLSACQDQTIDPRSWLASPTLTATASATSTETLIPSETPSPTYLPSETPTESLTPPPTSTASNTPEPSLTATLDGSVTVTRTPTITRTATVTRTATRTRMPTRTRFPTFTPSPTRTPTVTLTPTPPLAYFRINNIGPYSMVVSPLKPEAIVSPGEDGLIYVEIMGEDGRSITRQGLDFSNFLGRHVGIAPEIFFELPVQSETGRLTISSLDRYSRSMWLTSVDLVLLSIGRNVITAPQNLNEPYIVRQPYEGNTIQGGLLRVEGLARIRNENPLIIECIDPNRQVICSTQVALTAHSDELSHIPFEVYLSYQVSEPTNVRLTLRQESVTSLPGTISLYSFEITLQP